MVSSRPEERQRVSQACKRCSTSKIKCDGQLPCGKCSRSDNHCYYEEPKKRQSRGHPSSRQPAKRLAHRNEITNNDPETSDVSGLRQSPIIQIAQTTFASPLGLNVQVQSSETSTPSQPISNPEVGMDYAIGPNEMIPYNSTFNFFNIPNNLGFQDGFDNFGWMTGSLDRYLWPGSFHLGQELDMLQDTNGLDATSSHVTTAVTAAAGAPLGLTPTPASDIAGLYSRSHSPVLDKDAVEVRQYRPTSIEIDAPLHFPDVDPASLVDAELEDFAHVEPLSSEKVASMTQLAEEMQREPHHPPFTNLKLPPQPMLNAWVQLYFEHFHPVFPVLHKPTFSLPEVNPLLVLAVAGIGAQFSTLKNAKAFARSIHELVRRRSSSQCEKQNQLSRAVWMTQVIMLNNLAMSHSGDRRQLEIAEILQAVSIALARRTGLLEDVLPYNRIAKLQLPLEQAWRLWAIDEERRRTGFAVWLMDHTYRAHFNLTSILDPCELRNPLPQTEDRWDANSAQSWAQHPSGHEVSDRTQTLGDMCLNATWISTWSKTGTLGKQIILSELMEQARPRHPFHCHTGIPTPNRTSVKEALENILVTMDTQQDKGSSGDIKASLTHKVMCLTGLMTYHAPSTDLTVAALRQIYNRLDDHELSSVAQKWKECPAQGRTTVYYAARLLEVLRNNHATHYAMPVYLLRAALTLWLYARLFENSNLTGFSTSPGPTESVATNITNPNNVDVSQWTLAGCSRIRLPGIPDLLSLQGRRKLLSESITAMHSLKSWGISTVYMHLLQRLEATEAAA